MSNIKAAILVGGPLDGKSIEVDVKLHGYLQAVYDLPAQIDLDLFSNAKPSDVSPVRIATYKEMPDGTHWKYYSG